MKLRHRTRTKQHRTQHPRRVLQEQGVCFRRPVFCRQPPTNKYCCCILRMCIAQEDGLNFVLALVLVPVLLLVVAPFRVTVTAAVPAPSLRVVRRRNANCSSLLSLSSSCQESCSSLNARPRLCSSLRNVANGCCSVAAADTTWCTSLAGAGCRCRIIPANRLYTETTTRPANQHSQATRQNKISSLVLLSKSVLFSTVDQPTVGFVLQYRTGWNVFKLS